MRRATGAAGGCGAGINGGSTGSPVAAGRRRRRLVQPRRGTASTGRSVSAAVRVRPGSSHGGGSVCRSCRIACTRACGCVGGDPGRSSSSADRDGEAARYAHGARRPGRAPHARRRPLRTRYRSCRSRARRRGSCGSGCCVPRAGAGGCAVVCGSGPCGPRWGLFDEVHNQIVAGRRIVTAGSFLRPPSQPRDRRMLELSCARTVPVTASDVRRLRKRLRASQAVFAHYLNVSPKLVQAWGAGWRCRRRRR